MVESWLCENPLIAAICSANSDAFTKLRFAGADPLRPIGRRSNVFIELLIQAPEKFAELAAGFPRIKEAITTQRWTLVGETINPWIIHVSRFLNHFRQFHFNQIQITFFADLLLNVIDILLNVRFNFILKSVALEYLDDHGFPVLIHG
jgi:hypothetical protein